MIKIRSSKDFCAGIMFVAIGGTGMGIAQAYPFGSAARMGPGYFPSLISGLLVTLGLFISLRGLVVDGHKLGNFHFKPLLLVFASVVLFGFALEHFGLMIAIFTLVVLASLGGQKFRTREVFILAGILAVGSFFVFIYGLRLQIPIWPFSY
jgi:hypothetical protein